MKKIPFLRIFKWASILLIIFIALFVTWQLSKKVPTVGDWKDPLKVLSTAEFKDNLVTVKNVRNFQYDKDENATVKAYYDKTYDLKKLSKVWFISEPFDLGSPFAHTFLSFEFSDGAYLAISIEGRLLKGQTYNIINGTLHTFPLMYIAADERDVIYLRANVREEDVYVYPLKATPDQGRLLLVDMLNRMNDIAVHPTWYNSVYANCTSSIAGHVNKIWPGILPLLDWQVLFTNYADQLALEKGLLDTSLPLDQARNKYYVSKISRKIGYVTNYSQLIRKPN